MNYFKTSGLFSFTYLISFWDEPLFYKYNMYVMKIKKVKSYFHLINENRLIVFSSTCYATVLQKKLEKTHIVEFL